MSELKPLGWITEDYMTDKSATTYDPVVAERWRSKGWPVSPIYSTPQPVTPAGGEVARKRPFAFYNADKGTFFWLNEEVGAPEKVTGIINLYTHPPAADAALVRVVEAATHLVNGTDWGLGGSLSPTSSKRDIPSKAGSMVKTRHIASLRDALAALNQRGGDRGND